MERRGAGILLLLFAVLAAVVVPQILRPGTVGQASAAPLPAPPPVGSCVDLVGSSSTPADCADPHDGEVFASWAADALDRPRGRLPTTCEEELGRQLSPVLPSYTGWFLTTVNTQVQFLRAPDGERAGRRGWAACVVRPANVLPYPGTLLADVRSRPGAFGECLRADGVTEVSCTEGHEIERLAVAAGYSNFGTSETLDAGSLPADLAVKLAEQCREIAVDLTGAADPTFGGRIVVELVGAGVTRMGENAGNYRQYGASCVVRTPALLVDSLVGIGAGALPLG